MKGLPERKGDPKPCGDLETKIEKVVQEALFYARFAVLARRPVHRYADTAVARAILPPIFAAVAPVTGGSCLPSICVRWRVSPWRMYFRVF